MQYDKSFKDEAAKLSDEIGVKTATAQLGIPLLLTCDNVSLRLTWDFVSFWYYLNKNRNLLVGGNASGKITVLEVANVALGAYPAGYKSYVLSCFVCNISEDDVRRKNQQTAQKDVLISQDIEQYPCYIGTNSLWEEKNFQSIEEF